MKKYVFFFLFFVLLSGCTEGCDVRGIKVSQEMIDGGDMNGIDYCSLYSNALDGNSFCIKDYSTIGTFDGGFINVHGVYLIRLIDRLGDYKFVKAIEGISQDEKSIIGLYIEAGMDIYGEYYTGEGGVEYTSIKDFWKQHPKIFHFIKESTIESAAVE